MEATGFHYSITRRIRFQLQDVKQLRRYAVAHADPTLGQMVSTLTNDWLGVFESKQLTHDLDEHEFSLTIKSLDCLVRVCPVSPTLEQLAAGTAKHTDETEFRDELRGYIADLHYEDSRRNHMDKNQPWYCQPLNAITRDIWWICRVLISPKDGLVTVYADGFPQLKCKFKPRHGNQIDVFEVIDNRWSGSSTREDELVWHDWTPGTIHTLDDFISAMNETRRVVNGKWENWDDKHKVFVPTAQGQDMLPPRG